ncbi:hypothetical protein GH714_013582 [Hevea brasiliensis]|uniref:Uncharacterized protein n=1 Tax=Hevea brasiliensis TaxID=3981 RepID=A0A6A6NH00_HEVBR|nr:hypothetical protein GH714_013582 [Hevea brasiliensis]
MKNILSETNSEDNNDGVSRDDLLGGDKHNSGDDNFNGKEDDTSYNNSNGINHPENEPGNRVGSNGGSSYNQSSNSGDNLACNVDDTVVPSSINEDPTTHVLADDSGPKVPSVHVEDSASSSKQCSHLNYEIGLTCEEVSKMTTSTSFPSADVTISVQSIETLKCDLLMIN